jgi:photosystem II stability/assembly factor-like uncharacterized protein
MQNTTRYMKGETHQSSSCARRAASLLCSLLALSALGFSASATAQVNPKVMPQSGPLTKQTMSRLMLTDAARAGNRIVAVGDRGYIVYSDSNGESWERAKSPAGLPLLTGVYFMDDKTVWAVGHDSTILKSVDQGREWVQAFSSAKDQRPLLDIAFVDANTGYAVGAYGAFYETTDAGKTWTARKVIPSAPTAKPAASGKKGKDDLDIDDGAEKTSDEDKHLNSIIKLSDTRILIAGEAGTLLLSSDAGKTWSRVTSPYKGSFFGAVAADDGAVVIFGLRGNVYRSTDATLSQWKQVDVNTKASMMSGTKLAGGAIVLSGLSGTVLKSTDGGSSFSPLVTNTIKPLAAAVPAGPNSLLLVGESGARDVLLAAAAPAASTTTPSAANVAPPAAPAPKK